MKIKNVKVYSFNELSKDIQEKVLKREQEKCEVFLDFFNDDCIEQAKKNFWQDIKLGYSLGYCQGDGFSFSGELDFKSYLEKNYSTIANYKKSALCEYVYKIISNGNKGHYSYASENQIEIEYNYTNKELKHLEKLLEKILKDIKKDYVSLCYKFEKNGYNEIEYQQSFDVLKESLIDNDVEFLENGQQVNF